MSTTNTHSQSFNGLEQGKDTNFKAQEKRYFEYLKIHIATNSMVTNATGIPQKNLTRFKRDLEKQGLLYEIEKKLCKKTGFRAWYLTTNPELFPKSNQLKKF